MTPPRPALVAPSILASDFGRLHDETLRAAAAGADWIHWDVMDGVFVPAITFGPAAVAACRGATPIPFDVHLMVRDPAAHVDAFLEAGADLVTVHVESENAAAALDRVRRAGRRPGVTLRPGTPLEALDPHLADADLVLVMSVEPGRGGQAFLPAALDRIRLLAERRARLGARYLVSVDGGVSPATAAACRGAGADVLIAGTAVFDAPDAAAAVRAIRGA